MGYSEPSVPAVDKNSAAFYPALERSAELLRRARYTVALTGAGVSTPSGIPDFRSPHSGLWTHANPMEVASIYGFRQNPAKFYAWIRPLAHLMLEAKPNPAHMALASLEAMGLIRMLITQNIDTLHRRAGSRAVIEVHGHMREATCVECFRVYPTDLFLAGFIESGEIPRCPYCRGLLKPNTVLFGEQLPLKPLQEARRAARDCDLMLVVGSSLAVSPIADLPLIALAHDAQLIIINYEATYVDDRAAVVLHEDVARVLPYLVDLMEGKQGT